MLALSSTISFSQEIRFNLASELIKPASLTGLFLVSQSFQIKDKNGKKFGYEGNKFFGVSYSVGIKANGGVYVFDKVTNPWNYDENFAHYKNDYTPIAYKTLVKEIDDSVFKEIPTINAQINDKTGFAFVDQNNAKGFALSPKNEPKENWLVWVSTKNDLDSSTNAKDLILSIYKRETDFSKNTTIETPMTDGILHCGITLKTSYEEVGTIRFRMSGIIVNNGENWVWHPTEAAENKSTPSAEKKQKQGTLTPVEADDDKKTGNKSDNKKKKKS